TALLELVEQMPPLEVELPAGDRDPRHLDPADDRAGRGAGGRLSAGCSVLDRPGGPTVDAGAVEAVPARRRLLGEHFEILPDRVEWIGLRAEALELRMRPVPAGAPGQHRLGQQRLPPAAREALAVEVTGVQGPQAHRAILPHPPRQAKVAPRTDDRRRSRSGSPDSVMSTPRPAVRDPSRRESRRTPCPSPSAPGPCHWPSAPPPRRASG